MELVQRILVRIILFCFEWTEFLFDELQLPMSWDDKVSVNRRSKPDDGIALWFFKRIFALPFGLWHELIYSQILHRIPERRRPFWLDVYHYGTLGLLIWFYVIVATRAQQQLPQSTLTCVLVWLSLWRVYEGCTTAILLHCGQNYTTKSKPRAVLGVLMLYATVIVAFATCYAFLHNPLFDQEGFGARFVESRITPIYFSLVSITTVGYGDFSPKGFLEQIAVGSEVYLGIVLIVIIIQRAIAGEEVGSI